MDNRRVQIYHADELRLDSMIPVGHFGNGYLVTNRLMGYPSFVVGDKIVVGEAESGEIMAVVQSPMDDRWEIFYRVAETVEAVPAAEVEAVPARHRTRKPKPAAPPAGPAQAEAEARLASAMLASMEDAGGGDIPDAGGHENEG